MKDGTESDSNISPAEHLEISKQALEEAKKYGAQVLKDLGEEISW